MSGKGSKSRVSDTKKYKENFPKPSVRKVEGFVRVKGKLVKKY
jgi:hypothetical protein